MSSIIRFAFWSGRDISWFCVVKEKQMNTAKDEIKELLDKLPDDCTMEDVQYHIYVVEKINNGIERAKNEGTIGQEEAEKKLRKWTSK